jgi:hypothetical protein
MFATMKVLVSDAKRETVEILLGEIADLNGNALLSVSETDAGFEVRAEPCDLADVRTLLSGMGGVFSPGWRL